MSEAASGFFIKKKYLRNKTHLIIISFVQYNIRANCRYEYKVRGKHDDGIDLGEKKGTKTTGYEADEGKVEKRPRKIGRNKKKRSRKEEIEKEKNF